MNIGKDEISHRVIIYPFGRDIGKNAGILKPLVRTKKDEHS
jgi:hypothetical protein